MYSMTSKYCLLEFTIKAVLIMLNDGGIITQGSISDKLMILLMKARVSFNKVVNCRRMYNGSHVSKVQTDGQSVYLSCQKHSYRFIYLKL